MSSAPNETGKGVLYATGAFFIWGLFPLYWKPLHAVPALQILCHRIVWSAVFVAIVLLVQRNWRWLGDSLRDGARLRVFALSSLLLSFNWLIYIWAVNENRVVEASLGYFINPLVNVLLGVVFLRERMRPWQWAAIGLAFVGVAYLTLSYGRLPWIALTLALSFGFYGLIRKTAALESVQGLTIETGLMFLPAFGYLTYLGAHGSGAFGQGGVQTTLLLGCAGFVTAIPLILFAYGARRVQLTTLGVLQYVAPTLQFLLGVIVYGESFTQARVIGFCLIWTALLLYSIEGVITQRRAVAVATAS